MVPSKPMRAKVLVLASTYPRWENDHEPGFVHELSKRLAGNFEVSVLSPHAPGSAVKQSLEGVQVYRFRYAPARLETLVNDGGIVTNLKKSRWKWLLLPFFFAALCWSVFTLIRQIRPDVIHAHWLIPQGSALFFLRCLGVRVPPYVVTSHGADLFALRSKPLNWLKRQVAKHAATVTVVSRVMLEELVALGVPRRKIVVRSMGVDLTGKFIPGDFKERVERQQILFVGRMVEKKGARYLIEAIPQIAQEFPAVGLRVVGHGPERRVLEKLVASLGIENHVEFSGAKSQEQIADLARESSVFVAPFIETDSGDQEGLGLVLVEALGCGCPAVVTDLPAVKDVIEASEGICVVRQRSSEELATAIIYVLKEIDRYRQDVRLTRQKLVAKFDWASVGDAYGTILSDIARFPVKDST